MKDKTMINELRIWKSLTNNIKDLERADSKYKNYTQVQIDANYIHICALLLEEVNIADDDFIIVELPINKAKSFTLIPKNSETVQDAQSPQ